MASPSEHYSALLKRITTWATEEECGKGKIPQTKAQEDLIAERIGFALGKKIFHIDPSRHPAQGWFMRSKAPIVIAHTGNKWGKTFALLLGGLTASLGCCPWDPDSTELYNPLGLTAFEPPIRVMLVCQDFSTSLPEDIILRLKEIIPWDAIITRVSRVQGQVIDGFEFFNGTTWRILSHVQEDERYEGWSSHLILWNEPMPRTKFVRATRGAVEFAAPQRMAFTPISDPWIYDSLYLKSHIIATQADFDLAQKTNPPVIVVEGAIFQNPYLPVDAVERFIEVIPEGEREARIYGKWQHLSGLIFKQWSRDKHVRELAALI